MADHNPLRMTRERLKLQRLYDYHARAAQGLGLALQLLDHDTQERAENGLPRKLRAAAKLRDDAIRENDQPTNGRRQATRSRKMSAAQRKAISMRQRKYWAKMSKATRREHALMMAAKRRAKREAAAGV